MSLSIIRKYFEQIHLYTRNKHRVHRQNVKMSYFQNRTFYAGINIFSNLPSSVTILKNDKAKRINWCENVEISGKITWAAVTCYAWWIADWRVTNSLTRGRFGIGFLTEILFACHVSSFELHIKLFRISFILIGLIDDVHK
jgi:hypothetical protein